MKKELSLMYRLMEFQDYLDHCSVDDIDIAYELNRLSHKIGLVYDLIADKILD